MSYSTASTQKFTLIEDLPDLDDLEGPRPQQNAVRQGNMRGSHYPGGRMLPNGQEDRFAKFIRQSHDMPSEAGMESRMVPSQLGHPPQTTELYEESPSPTDEVKTYKMPEGTPTCLDIAEHVANCPICSKFYNDDKTIYIIAIVILAIVCVLLLKKVLDQN